jgi:hypothetical protein
LPEEDAATALLIGKSASKELFPENGADEIANEEEKTVEDIEEVATSCKQEAVDEEAKIGDAKRDARESTESVSISLTPSRLTIEPERLPAGEASGEVC